MNRLQKSSSRFLSKSLYQGIALLMLILSTPLSSANNQVYRIPDKLELTPDGKVIRDMRQRPEEKSEINLKYIPATASECPERKTLRVPQNPTEDATTPEDTDGYKVKVNFHITGDGESEGFFPMNINVFNKDNKFKYSGYSDELDEDLSYTFIVPEGIYDIFTTIFMIGPKSRILKTLCIAHCSIEVKGDTETTFDNSEASHLVYMEKLLPDGSNIVLPTPTYLDQEPWVEWDFSKANAYGFQGFQSIFNPYAGELYGSFLGADAFMEMGDSYFGLWTNEMSDNYTYEELVLIDSFDGLYSVAGATRLSKEALSEADFHLVNNPNNYEALTGVEVHHAPSWYTLPENQQQKGWRINTWVDARDMGAVEFNYNGDLNIQVCKPNGKGDSGNWLNVAYSQLSVEYSEKIPDLPEDLELFQTEFLICIPKIQVGGEWMYINHHNAGYGGPEAMPEGWSVVDGNGIQLDQLPGQEVYSFPAQDCETILGNSCPISATRIYTTVTGIGEDEDGKQYWIYGNALSANYIGRLGEMRNMDTPTLLSAKIDGKEVDLEEESMNVARWYGLREADSSKTPGKVELTFTDTNVTVDNLTGKNETTISYDERNEDICLPSLSMLIFRDTDNMVTDRFSTPEDGIMYFSAGDFNWNEKWFVCDPIDVEVEYTPYGKEDFKPLECVEVPELFFMPTFGYCYKASLKDISTPSDNGWYSLRFKVTDRAGNSQQQLVEPSFYIKDVASFIETVADDSKVCGVYRADGVFVGEVSSPEDCYKFASGIYIVRYKTADGMKVKKVLVP